MMSLRIGKNKMAVVVVFAISCLLYNKSLASDPVQLHINKTVFNVGELAHVKGYIVRKSEVDPFKDLSMALIDISSKKAITTFRLKGSQLYTGITIPLKKTLKSSVYQLKVFDENFIISYTSTSFLVINPEDEQNVFPKDLSEPIEFHIPGGGDIIAGLENNMVLRYKGDINDNSGSVVIKNQYDSMVAKFDLKKSGLSKIKFVPEVGLNYYGEVLLNESVVAKKQIPAASEQGIIANSIHTAQRDLIVDFLFVKTSAFNHRLKIFNKGNLIEEYSINDNHFRRQFVASSLPEGIIQFAVFNGEGQLVKNQLAFNRHREKLRFNVTPEKSSYQPGEIVRLNISSVNEGGSSVSANMSVSITDANQALDLVTYRQNIWALDFSEVNRAVGNLGNYFEPDLQDEWNLDDLMITLSQVPENKTRRNVSDSGPSGIHVSGKVINTISGKVPKGVVLTIPDLNGTIRYAPVNANGTFYFGGFDFEGSQNAYLSVWPTSSSDLFDWNVDQAQPNLGSIKFALSETDNSAFKNLVRFNDIRTRIKQQYINKEEEIPILEDPRDIPLASIPYVDKTIQMDDYIYLPNMKTVIKEVVPYTQTKKTGFKVFSPELRRTFPGRPLILLDGIPVKDSVILNQDPIIFQKIELINTFKNIYKIGKVAENGIVAFYTRPGHSVEQINTLEIDLKGYYQNDSTNNSDKTTPNSNIPYMPASLYWASNIDTSSDKNSIVEFKAPDYETEVIIHIEGVSPKIGHGISEYSINIKR